MKNLGGGGIAEEIVERIVCNFCVVHIEGDEKMRKRMRDIGEAVAWMAAPQVREGSCSPPAPILRTSAHRRAVERRTDEPRNTTPRKT